MHIINKTFLKFALLPKGLYRRMGVNTAHLEAILTAKLIMDDRRPNTLHQTQRHTNNKPVNAATVGTILVSAFMGLVYLISFAIGPNMLTHLTFYFSFFFFLLAASLISDFTAVLIDVRDNYIILPKPVSDRTVVVARILHIFIHICKLVAPMSLPGLVYIIINYGALGGLYFLLLVLLLTIFVIFFINALYILILRITTPARFQAIISYIQIGFAIALYASYQILPRMADGANAFHFDVTTHPTLFLLPMYWFASGWNTLYTLHAGGWDVLFLFLCVVVPLASLYAVVRYLAPSFNNKLALLNSVNAETAKPIASTKNNSTTSRYVRTLSRLATGAGAERMGFLFTWKMTARSRDFKVRVYPSIGYLAVLVVMLFLRRGHIRLNDMQPQDARIMLMSVLYITSFLLITAIGQLTQSEKAKASWLYFIAPVQQPGVVISGAFKATLLKFYMPVAVVTAVAALYFIGWAALPNLILGVLNQVLITSVMVYGSYRVFPFSLQQNNNTKTANFSKNLLLLMVSGFIGLGHYLVYNILSVVLIFAVLSAIASWLLLSSIKDTSWEKITTGYAQA